MSDLLVKPYSYILVNAPSHYVDGQCVCKSFTILRDTLISIGYLVTKVNTVWARNEFKKVIIIEFGCFTNHCTSAFKLAKMFEKAGHGRTQWANDGGQQSQPYLWVATHNDESYFRSGSVDVVAVENTPKDQADIEANAETTSAYANVIAAFIAMYR